MGFSPVRAGYFNGAGMRLLPVFSVHSSRSSDRSFGIQAFVCLDPQLLLPDPVWTSGHSGSRGRISVAGAECDFSGGQTIQTSFR